jgi:hypothetical protein
MFNIKAYSNLRVLYPVTCTLRIINKQGSCSKPQKPKFVENDGEQKFDRHYR